MVREVFFSRIEAEMEVVQDFKLGLFDMVKLDSGALSQFCEPGDLTS